MTLPLAVKLVDVIPMQTWLSMEDIKRKIEKKYGPQELKRVQAVVSNMQRSKYCKIDRRPLDKSRYLYQFNEIDFAYIKLVIGKERPDDLPRWVTDQIKPAISYPPGFLMAEFNNLLSRARHV